MASDTSALVALLRKFYTDDEAFKWLTLPQPAVRGRAVPLDMIAAGRIDELVLLLRRMDEGVYL